MRRQALPCTDAAALSSRSVELQHLQRRLEYAQSLAHSIHAIGAQHTRTNMVSHALDQAYVPVRQSLEALQTRVHYAGLEVAEDHRRLSQMRRHVSFEATQLSTLQDGIGEVRRRLQEARRDADVNDRLEELQRSAQLDGAHVSSLHLDATVLPPRAFVATMPVPRGLPMFDRLQSSLGASTDLDRLSLEEHAQQVVERALNQPIGPKLEDLPHPNPAYLLRAQPGARTRPPPKPKPSQPAPEPEPEPEPELESEPEPPEPHATCATPAPRRRFNPLATSLPADGTESCLASAARNAERSETRDKTTAPAQVSDNEIQHASRSRASLPSAVVQRSARYAVVAERRQRLTQGNTVANATGVVSRPGRPRLECSICMEVLMPSAEVAQDCAILPQCGHVFHRVCIAPWLWKNSCPLCRCPVQQSQHHVTRRS